MAEQTRWTAGEARAAFAAAPHASLDVLAPAGGTLLVVAPHPDDESLGCGGLIACAADARRKVLVAVLTDGAASHPGSRAWPAARLAGLRDAEVRAAVRRLAGTRADVATFGAPDGRLREHGQAAQAWLASLVEDRRIVSVVTSWEADPHPDHKAAFALAAVQAARSGAALFAYPIWGLTLEADDDAGVVGPCLSLDVSAVLDRKRAAIAAHRSQTTGLIEDDPRGFRLQAGDIARHLGPREVFLRAEPSAGEGCSLAGGAPALRVAPL